MKMKVNKVLMSALLVCSFFCFQSLALAEVKIGFVDIQAVLSKTKSGKKARAEMEKEIDKKKKEVQTKEKELQKLSQDFEKKAMALSNEMKQKKSLELQQEYAKVREFAAKAQMDLQNRDREIFSPIYEKMKKSIAKVAKENNLSMLLEKNEQSLSWTDDALDMTDKVVETFDKM